MSIFQENIANDPTLRNFDAASFAKRFYGAMKNSALPKGVYTDEAEMDRLYNELTHNQFTWVMNYWDMDPALNEGESLLEWIDGDEDGFRYARWVSLSKGEPPLTEESYKADNPLARNSQLDLNQTEIELGVTKWDKVNSYKYGGGGGSMK